MVKANKDNSWVNKFDIFGVPVHFTFRGSKQFRSYLGGMASILCYFIIAFVIILQSQELFFGHDQAFHFASDIVTDYGDIIDLKTLNFFFAVENLNPAVARLKVSQVSREDGRVTPIPMVDCEQLINGNEEIFTHVDLETISSYYERSLLCPNVT